MALLRRRCTAAITPPALLLALTLGLAACSGAADPGTQPSSGPSASTTPTPAVPQVVDAAAVAITALKSYLAENDFTVRGIKGSYITFSQDGETFTSKVTCDGGASHEPGWTGICAAPSKKTISFVIPVRIAASGKPTSVVMDEDTAAYCGDDTTPAWVVKALKASDPDRYCFLTAEDG